MGDFHYPFSASSSKRWLNCSASVRIKNEQDAAYFAKHGKLPEEERSVYAAEGTMAHEVCEHLLAGRMLDELPKGTTEEMIEGAKLYISEIKKHIDGNHFFIEDRLEVVKDLCGGTADFWCFDEDFDSLYCFDYKFGKGIEVYPNDPQTGIYNLGVLKKLGRLPKHVRSTIVQPRLRENRVKHHVWTKAELNLLNLGVHDAITSSATAEPNPGDWCRFCPVATCEAKAKFLTEKVCLDFPAEKKAPVLPPAVTMSKDQRIAVLTYRKAIKTWLDDVQDYCDKEAEEGVEYEGFMLKPGRITRKWASDKAALECLTDCGMRKEEMFKSEILSPAQAEKVIGKAKAFKAFAPFLDNTEGKASLVPSKTDFDD